MSPKHIKQKIIDHDFAYRAIGKEVPPFRITCREHKILREFSIRNEKEKYHGKFGFYYGVELEIVTEVEEY